MKQFALTATRLLTDRPTTTEDYMLYLVDLPKTLTVEEVHYEVGKTSGRLHIHALVNYSGKIKPTGKKVYKTGWNVVLEPVQDLEGWLRYIRKERSLEALVRLRWSIEYDDLLGRSGTPEICDLPKPINSLK